MRLMGRDITADTLMAYVGERLRARGLAAPRGDGGVAPSVELPVDPLSFNLEALTEHADATKGLPVETHRGGLSGGAVRFAKLLFRHVGQVFINEALARQVVFNGHVRDAYAQLSAEVLRLRARLDELEGRAAKPAPARTSAKSRRPTS
jgi:DNA-binding response OmpR family regulator